MRFSALKILQEGLTGNKGWTHHWRDPQPKSEYDIVIIGGGGHGLATAYYLAKRHGLTNIAVLEKGYIGGGNVGRNTTIVRANYGMPGNSEFYSHSLKLWEGLEQDLNYNVMHSQRGIINLFHSDGQRDAFAWRGNAIRNQGDDAELLDRDDLRKMLPYLNFDNARFPVRGGLLQRRGGTARHDAVVWGLARVPISAVLTSSKIAKSPALISKMARSKACKHPAVPFAPKRWASWLPAVRAKWRPWRVCVYRLRAIFYRPLSPKGLSLRLIMLSALAWGIFISANRTKAGWCSAVIWIFMPAMHHAATCP